MFYEFDIFDTVKMDLELCTYEARNRHLQWWVELMVSLLESCHISTISDIFLSVQVDELRTLLSVSLHSLCLQLDDLKNKPPLIPLLPKILCLL